MSTRSLRPRQMGFDDLLPAPAVTPAMHDRVAYNGVPARLATFKSGLAERVHRWFRLTPSFGPELVRQMLTALNCAPTDVVLDPFAGAGTTLIECQLEQIKAYGLELNPLLQFVSSTSLAWDVSVVQMKTALESIERTFTRMAEEVHYNNLGEYGLEIPHIHNPTRWWRSDVLAHILILKHAIGNCSNDSAVQDFFRLALAGILVPDLTNVTLGRLQLHFIVRDGDRIDVLSRFVAHANTMIADLISIQAMGLRRTSSVTLTDSTLPIAINLEAPVNCVVTSPPYPNRYSYVWNTRPHLYLLDFLSTAKQAADLDKRAIGGTWGTATSQLAKGTVLPEHPAVAHTIGPVVDAIRRNDSLMANYAMKYFNGLSRQIQAMEGILAPDARIAYVVGCSRLKGVYVETDVLLAQIIERLELGYAVANIERIRKRNSGKNLHESIVYAWKR